MLSEVRISVLLNDEIHEIEPWDLPALDLQALRPVRSFAAYRRQKRHPGLFWCYTTGRFVPYESRLEAQHLLIADFDPTVEFIVAQPFRLRLLTSYCDGCGRGAQSGRQDGSTIPVLPSVVPDVQFCHNPLPAGVGISGRKEVCGFELQAVTTDSLDGFGEIIVAQQRLNARLADGPSDENLAYFRRLRSLCAAVLAGANRNNLGPLPTAAEAAWEAHERERAGLLEHRAVMRRRDMDGRRAPRQRVWTGAPVNAPLLAAVVPTALAAAHDPERLAAIASSARALRPTHAPQFPVWFHMPADLSDQWERTMRETAPRLTDRLVPAAATQVDARFIPRLWPLDLYQRDVGPLFAGVSLSPTTIRAYVSLLAVRQALDCSWQQAGYELGHSDARKVITTTNNVVTKLRWSGRDADFLAAVPAILRALNDQPRVDFRAREQSLRSWRGFTPAEWFEIRVAAGVRPGRTRDRYAAAWLWAELTGCDWRSAPSLGGAATESDREAFRRFTAEFLPQLRDPLRRFGERLVDDAAVLLADARCGSNVGSVDASANRQLARCS